MPALPVAQQDTAAQQSPSPDTQAVMDQLRAQQAQASQAQPQQGGALQLDSPAARQALSGVDMTMAPGTPQQGNLSPSTEGTLDRLRSDQTNQKLQSAQDQQPQQGQPQQGQPQQGQPSGQQVGPTATSEKPPLPRPFVDPRPYASLAEHAPQYRAIVDQVSQETGASPQRLALTWAQEGGFKVNVPDGKAGEKGPMQILPSTFAQYDAKNQMDPHELKDSLTVAGRYIHDLDGKFGIDSPSSVGAYQGGEGSIRDIMAHPDRAMQDHPNTMARVQSSFPGQQVTPGHFTGAMDMKPQELVQAAQQGGPDGFLKYVAQTAAQSGTSMTDGMRQAEQTLVGFMASKGDIDGMQHARDFVLQLAHSGANQYLMQAHQALGSGDGQGAAQALAKAHAFFPDGTMGSFGVDNKGQVWGQRMDEHTGKQMGPMFQVDQQGVQQMMNQTTDPGKFLATVHTEQKNAADIRHQDAMGKYYADLIPSRELIAHENNDTKTGIAGGNNDARVEAAQVRADGTVTAAGIRAGRQGQGPAAALSKQADKEASDNFNEVTMPGDDDATVMSRGKMAEIYHDVRMGGVTGPQSLAVTKGIAGGKLQLVKGQDGRYGVMDPKDRSGQPIAIISQAMGDRLAGATGINRPQQAQGAIPGAGPQPGNGNASPIGAGANSAAARVTGVGNDLSGTVQPQQQSSAIPTS